jgi:hypothetical protein
MNGSTTRASILVPTHDKHTTLPLAVDTALRQSVEDVEVIVIGDGVTPELREVIEAFTDPRVRFLDLPKGPHHGERYRHEAIVQARSDAIFYLCDDDLLLPDHVADLLGLLEDHNFVQSFNGFVRTDGELDFYAADLADASAIELMLDPALRHCSVSITGTAHSRRFYEEVGEHWDTTPPGEWADHWQWKKLFRHPGFRGATSERMTALQLPTTNSGREAWSPEQREAELRHWYDLVVGPDPQPRIDALVHRASRRALAEERKELAVLRHAFDTLTRELDAARASVVELRTTLDRVDEEKLSAYDELERLRLNLARTRERLARKNRRLAALRAQRPGEG